MPVIIYAEDLSGRRDDGHYTKPDIDIALDIFFSTKHSRNFLEPECENPFSRDEAKDIFLLEKRVVFFNEEGEKVVISLDL